MKKLNKIAILSWDSSVNNPKNLAKIIGPWKNDGPVLPIELTRISKDSRLTPVLDEKDGTNCKTFYALAKIKDLNKVVKELAAREKLTNSNRISFIDLANQKIDKRCFDKYQVVCNKIIEWAQKNKIDCVVFSSLGRKFKDTLGIKFSLDNAYNYLYSMPAKKRGIALKYINSLPESTDTKLRKYLMETGLLKK